MHNLTGLLIRLNSLFDQFHEIQAGFESDANSAGDSIFLDLVFYKKLHRESHLQAERIQAEMEEYGGMPVWPVAAEELSTPSKSQMVMLAIKT